MFEEKQKIEALILNPLDVNLQAKSADRIRLPNVQKNMEIAIEVMHESFVHFRIIYIPCTVNKTILKSFFCHFRSTVDYHGVGTLDRNAYDDKST